MNTAEITALLILAGATSFTPGPNTTLSTALAANLGLRRAMRFVLAVPLGWGLLFTLCAAGLGTLVLAVPALHRGLQLCGMAYLLWLALRLARSATPASPGTLPMDVTFWQGVALQFLNIKAWMLALTVVAGWLAGREDALQRFAMTLPLMLAFGFFSNLLYAALGSWLRAWLSGPVVDGQASGRRLRGFNRAMAAVLVLTAAWMGTL